MSNADDSFDLEVAAAALRADSSDVRILLKVLVERLADALGARLIVRRAGGLRRKSQEIRSVVANLGDDQFSAEIDGASLRCAIGHSSGGIRIRSEQVDVDTWLSRLLERLNTEATHSQATRLALENIVIGGKG